MGDIYTQSWYDEVRDAINHRVAELDDVPAGTWHVAVDIDGDGRSPYVPAEGARHFLVSIEDGTCRWYRELNGEDPGELAGGRLDFRFRGPASAFDEIAAGLADPIEAALRGRITVRGDMRFLMRQADHVQALLEAYGRDVDTTWPSGRPPYA